MQTEGFTIDLAAKQVTTAEGPVRLTPTEWSLLEVLVRNTGKLVSRKQLLQDVWAPTYEAETNYLRVYIAQLRGNSNSTHPVPDTSSPNPASATASSCRASGLG